METIISGILGNYESGKLTRRELVAALAGLVAAGSSTAVAAVGAVQFDHVSLEVRDLNVSRDFYSKVLGLEVKGQGGPENTVRLGHGQSTFLVLRDEPPPGRVDHFALRVPSFDKPRVTAALRQLGVTPIDDGSAGPGFHIKDPDGFNVQLV